MKKIIVILISLFVVITIFTVYQQEEVEKMEINNKNNPMSTTHSVDEVNLMNLKTFENTFFKFKYPETWEIYDDFKETNNLIISFEKNDNTIIDITFKLIEDVEITQEWLMSYHDFFLLPTLEEDSIKKEDINQLGNLQGKGVRFYGDMYTETDEGKVTGFTFISKLKTPVEGRLGKPVTQISIDGYYGNELNNKPTLNEEEQKELEVFFDSIEIIK